MKFNMSVWSIKFKYSHIENEEKFCNNNIRLCMKLKLFLLNYEIGSFIGNLQNNTHM